MSARMKHLTGAAALMVLLGVMQPVNVSAQTAFGIKWFGEIRPTAPPRTLAIGGISAVTPWGEEPVTLGQRNPALNAFSEKVLYGLTWELGRLSGSYGGETGTLWQYGPRMLGLILPLGGGVAVSANLHSLTYNEFEVHTSSTMPDGVSRMYHNYIGTGGLSEGSFSLAWRLPSGALALGVSTDLIFGSIKHEWAVTFDSAGYVNTRDQVYRQHKGHRMTAGVQVEPIPSLRIGAALSNRGELNIKHIYSTVGSISDTSEGKLQPAGTMVVGAGFSLTDKWAVYLDYNRVSWDRAEWIEEPVQPSGSPVGIADIGLLTAESDIGIGFERRTPPVDQQIRFIDTIPLRAGVRLGTFYAPDTSGDAVKKWYGTLGTALDIGREGRTWADLTLQFGSYSTSGDAHEFFWRVQIGITGAERWFLPPQR
ncbi:hypothetical protein ACFL44_00300 [Gemmatimonadota bacterium]